MPALPPVPADVLRLTIAFDVDGSPASVGFWLAVPNAAAADLAWLDHFLGEVITGEVDALLRRMHAGAVFDTCRGALHGLVLDKSFSFAAGIWTGGQAQGITLTLHAITGEGRRSSSALVHLPAVPDQFIIDSARISELGFGNLAALSDELYARLNAHVGPAGGSCLPIVLHRKTVAGPLAAAIATPIVGYAAGTLVSTIRRRLPHARQHSPRG